VFEIDANFNSHVAEVVNINMAAYHSTFLLIYSG